MAPLIALLLAAAPATTDAVAQSEVAVLECEQAAARQWDDQISDASTIAKMVVNQCMSAREREAQALAAKQGAQTNSVLSQMIRDDVVSAAPQDALFAVLHERQITKIKQRRGDLP